MKFINILFGIIYEELLISIIIFSMNNGSWILNFKFIY